MARFLKKHKHLLIWLAGAITAFILAFVLVPDLIARPGGGGGFSSGGGGGGGFSGGGGYSGGGYSGSGGGGGGGAILFYLLIKHLYIGIPLLILFIYLRFRGSKKSPQRRVDSTPTIHKHLQHSRQINAQLERYKQEDPNFSKVLFLDFVQKLYYQFHHHRSKPEFDNLRPYFGSNVFDKTKQSNQARVDVSELVIGSMRIAEIHQSQEWDTFTIEFDANYTETRNNHSNRFMVISRWVFRRKRGVSSKTPKEMENLGCPNCGAALEVNPSGDCKYCGTVVSPGIQQWGVANIYIHRRQTMPAQRFGHYVPEAGTNAATIYDTNLQQQIQRFAQRHQIMNWADYERNVATKIVTPIFLKIYEGWSELKWEKTRALTTDNLFQSFHYWIELYRKHRVVNKLTKISINKVELVKIESDKYYESFTVRIFASLLDYMETFDGKHLGGSKTSRRGFSEYWTFVRATSAQKSEQDFSTDNCPNCGAPVDKMGMTGICGYCETKVTTGEFNWVLSTITQDEVYYG